MIAAEFEIITARLFLSPVVPLDGPRLLSFFRDAEVRRYLLDDVIVSEAWVHSEIAGSEARFAEGSGGLWRIQQGVTGPVIGFVGFREFFDPPELQLLYGLSPAHWGQGIATEAARAAVGFAFDALGFLEIRAATDSPNRRSARVLERLGMKHCGHTGEGVVGTEHYVLERLDWTGEVRNPEQHEGADG